MDFFLLAELLYYDCLSVGIRILFRWHTFFILLTFLDFMKIYFLKNAVTITYFFTANYFTSIELNTAFSSLSVILNLWLKLISFIIGLFRKKEIYFFFFNFTMQLFVPETLRLVA